MPLLKSAGLPPIRIHDLRHTQASLLLAAGEPVLNVSRRLGHANATLTLNTYAHVMPDADRGIAARLDAMLETGTGWCAPGVPDLSECYRTRLDA